MRVDIHDSTDRVIRVLRVRGGRHEVEPPSPAWEAELRELPGISDPEAWLQKVEQTYTDIYFRAVYVRDGTT